MVRIQDQNLSRYPSKKNFVLIYIFFYVLSKMIIYRPDTYDGIAITDPRISRLFALEQITGSFGYAGTRTLLVLAAAALLLSNLPLWSCFAILRLS